MTPGTPPHDMCTAAAALDLIRSEASFLLVGHQRPDGDVLGAQVALARILASMGKSAHILNPDPPQAQFDYLTRSFPFQTFEGGALPAHDVLVLLDFCELSRTGEMAPVLAAAGSKKLVIDHHLPAGNPWWDAALVDQSASATGLLIYRLARELGAKIDAETAAAVFTSLVTDTGWFKYSNTDAETLRAAAAMTERGVQPARLYQAIYQRTDQDQPRAIGRLLSRLEYFDDGRLVVADLPLARAEEADLADGDEVMDILRAVHSVQVVLFLRELRDGTVKLSARSKADYDVNRLARKFGGGGHAKAAGASLTGSLADVRTRVIAAARDASSWQ